jgi:hypothetical protein
VRIYEVIYGSQWIKEKMYVGHSGEKGGFFRLSTGHSGERSGCTWVTVDQSANVRRSQ